jgi:hypothetical protein
MVTLPWCTYCKHVALEEKTRANGEKYLPCSAFPNGIPDEILADQFKHDKPYPGDHGIQFESATPVPQFPKARRAART